LEQPSDKMRLNKLKTVLCKLFGGTLFRYTAVDCTEKCFIQVGGCEQSSGILRWTVLNNDLYRFRGEHFSGLLRWTVLNTD